jgi:hypothetical protein
MNKQEYNEMSQIDWDFVVYIDTGSPVPNIPSKSHGLADENEFFLTEWKWLYENKTAYFLYLLKDLNSI